MVASTPTLEAHLKSFSTFRHCREPAAPAVRRERIVQASREFREQMLLEEPVVYFRSLDLVRVPYPRRYGLREACSIPLPYIHILNRMFVVQCKTSDGVKTVLVSPSDVERGAETPFFKRLSASFGPFRSWLEPLFAPILGDVPSHLERLGIQPADVDYLTYDHLHTQDLRRWMVGVDGKPPVFPRAKLLVTRQEWDSTRALLPPQKDWYCPGGIEGIPEEKVVFFDEDLQVGKGLALVRTPGHTEGNHSIVVHANGQLYVTSENGISADCYAPEKSRIPGLRRYARNTGMDIVLNGNTLEGALDQYLSMVQEKEIAGPSKVNPDFPNVLPSSELTPYWLFPGIRPSFQHGSVEFGTLVRKDSSKT